MKAVAILVFGLAVAFVFGWGFFLFGCNAAQLAEVRAVASADAPAIQAACSIASDTGPAAPYLDLLCIGAEAADRILANLPQGTGAIVQVMPAPIPPPAGDAAPAARLSLYRLRVLLASSSAPRVVHMGDAAP